MDMSSFLVVQIKNVPHQHIKYLCPVVSTVFPRPPAFLIIGLEYIRCVEPEQKPDPGTHDKRQRTKQPGGRVMVALESGARP